LRAAKTRFCWATAAPGKPTSHWLSALAACQKGYRVRFTTAAAMVHELIEAKDEKRAAPLSKANGRFTNS